mgnify:CR=1 FL=1
MARRALGPATLEVVQAVSGVPDGGLVVACSGGADSLALAAAAALVAGRRGSAVRALVVDHGLQDGSAAVAAAVAEQLTSQLDLSAAVATVSVVRGDGPEADARAARYAALEAAAVDDEVVLLGHTLDDQAETVLLGLARGSGPRSLAGMPARRGRFVRPLLEVRRAVTAAACAELGLSPWQDPHNSEARFARVRVRERVLPVLEAELGPGVAEALARSADLFRVDADHLDGLAAVAAAEVAGETIDCDALAAVPPALRSRVLRGWLAERGAGQVSAQHLRSVEVLIDHWHGQRWVDLPDLRVMRSDGRLMARPR